MPQLLAGLPPLPEVTQNHSAEKPKTAEIEKVPEARPSIPPMASGIAMAWPGRQPQRLNGTSPAPSRPPLEECPSPLTAAFPIATPAGAPAERSPRAARDLIASRMAGLAGTRLAPQQSPEVAPPAQRAPVGIPLRLKAQPATAGLVDYSRAAKRSVKPANSPARSIASATEPRITLPGPALLRALTSLSAAGFRTVYEVPRATPRRKSGAGIVWLALTAVVVCLAVGLYTIPPLLVNNRPSAVRAQTPVVAEQVRSVAGAYPLSKTVEVTGFRFVVDLNNRAEIHYLVVNHSPAQLRGVTVYVTLRGGDTKPGQPPLARFSFRAPDMSPYTSREMSSPIEKMSRSVNLPDWQDLHADVEIAE